MKLRVLLYSDLHFADPHLEAASLALLRLQAYLVEHKPDAVVNLGDTFHSKDYVSSRTLSAVSTALREIRDICDEVHIPHFVLSGNHDIADRSGDEYSSDILALAPSIRVVRSGSIEEVGGFKLGFLNYRPKHEDVLKDIRRVSGADAVFSHLPLHGALFNPTRAEEGGIEPSTLGCRWIFSGHYHHPQVMRSSACTTVIVGSPCYYTWGDEVMFDEKGVVPRGFLLVDFEKKAGGKPISVQFQRLPNTYAEVRHTARVNISTEVRDEQQTVESIRESLGKNQKLKVRAIGESAEELAASDFGQDVQFTLTSATRRVALPDAPEVKVHLADVDHGALIERVIAESDMNPAMQKRVKATVLQLLEESRETA